jgi:hypothetical protein
MWIALNHYLFARACFEGKTEYANGHLNFTQIDFVSKIFVRNSFIISMFIIDTNKISI